MQAMIGLYYQDSEKSVQSTEELKDELYRLKRQKDEMEIVISEQNEKLEVLEANGLIGKDGEAVLFEDSARYKEMSLVISQQRHVLEERGGMQ